MFATRPFLTTTKSWLIAAVATLVQPLCKAQDAQPASVQQEPQELLANLRQELNGIRSLELKYDDGSEFEHTFRVDGEQWQLSSQPKSSSAKAQQLYIQSLSNRSDGKRGVEGIVEFGENKSLCLRSYDANEFPTVISRALNPWLVPFSWLAPEKQITWSDLRSDQLWQKAVAGLRFSHNEEVNGSTTQVYRTSKGSLVHTVWLPISRAHMPVQGKIRDLQTRSTIHWTVDQTLQLPTGARVPSVVTVRVDDLATIILNVQSAKFEKAPPIDAAPVQAEHHVTLDVNAPEFPDAFESFTKERVGIQKNFQGKRFIDLASNMGKIAGSKKSRGGDEVLQKLSKLPSKNVDTLELSNSMNITDAGLRYLRPFREVETLYLYRTNVRGDGLRHLAGLSNLSALSLAGTPLENGGMLHLASLPQLKWLDLSATSVTDEGIEQLSSASALVTLSLSDTRVSDASVPFLCELPNLKNLSLNGTAVTSTGLNRLKEQLPDCDITASFHLGKTAESELLFPVGYKPSAAEITAKLRELQIDGEVEVDEQGAITQFRAFGVCWSSEVFLQLLNAMPDLKTLNTRQTFIDDQLLLDMNLPNLEYLDLTDSLVTNDGVRHLQRCKKLQELHLPGTTVSDASLEDLFRLTSLRTLRLNPNRISLESFHKIRSFLRENQKR